MMACQPELGRCPQYVGTGMSYLCQLSDDSVALVADQLLDVCIAEDGLLRRADLDAATGRDEQLQPPLARQCLRDHHPLLTILVVHL